MTVFCKNCLSLALLLWLPLLGACAMFPADPTPEILHTSSRGDALDLTLKVRKGQCYQVEKATDLRKPDWKPVGSVITARTDRATITDNNIQTPAGFYRVRLLTR